MALAAFSVLVAFSAFTVLVDVPEALTVFVVAAAFFAAVLAGFSAAVSAAFAVGRTVLLAAVFFAVVLAGVSAGAGAVVFASTVAGLAVTLVLRATARNSFSTFAC